MKKVLAFTLAFMMLLLSTSCAANKDTVINDDYPVIKAKNGTMITCGYEHTVALKSDGKVIAAGENEKGQCEVSEWVDIVAVSAGGDNTVGLKHDGTLVIYGEFAIKEYGVDSWKNIKMP